MEKKKWLLRLQCHPFQSSPNLSIRASFCVCRVICTFLSLDLVVVSNYIYTATFYIQYFRYYEHA